MTKIASPEALKTYREELVKARPEDQPVIAICNGTGCVACGSAKVVAAFKEELKRSFTSLSSINSARLMPVPLK